MIRAQDVTTKKKVSQFDEDARHSGLCAFTAKRLSSSLAESNTVNFLLAEHML